MDLRLVNFFVGLTALGLAITALNQKRSDSQGTQGPQGIQGVQGIQGNTGPQGIQGSAGASLTILGSYANLTAFNAAKSAGSLDAYKQVGNAFILLSDGSLMCWSAVLNDWFDAGDIKGPQGDQGIQGIQGIQGNQGIQGIQGIQGVKGDPGDTLWGTSYATFLWGKTNGVSQENANPQATRFLQFDALVNQDGPINNITLQSGANGLTQVKVLTGGTYKISYSIQVGQTQGGALGIFILWAKINGTNVPASSSQFAVQGSTSQTVAFCEYIFTLSANDYVELCWTGTDPKLKVYSIAGSSTPVAYPVSPALIYNIYRIA